MTKKAQCAIFRVNTTEYCLWDWNLHERNMEFINGINPEYFMYQAKVHFDNIESEDKQLASVALRTAYHHGLETLFTLLGATVQAPNCVYGWILKSRAGQVRALAKRIDNQEQTIFNKLGMNRVSWYEISRRMHAYLRGNVSDEEEIVQFFAELWTRFYDDFSDEMQKDEYNSIKHGFRTALGGFAMSFGLEDLRRKTDSSPLKMFTVGGYGFGSTFLSIRKIEGSPCPKKDPHFCVTRNSINWVPENMLHGLGYISMSLNNIMSYLKILNGEDASRCRFCYSTDPEAFYKPWDIGLELISGSTDTKVTEGNIRRLGKKEIDEALEKFKIKD